MNLLLPHSQCEAPEISLIFRQHWLFLLRNVQNRHHLKMYQIDIMCVDVTACLEKKWLVNRFKNNFWISFKNKIISFNIIFCDIIIATLIFSEKCSDWPTNRVLLKTSLSSVSKGISAYIITWPVYFPMVELDFKTLRVSWNHIDPYAMTHDSCVIECA